MTPHLFKLIEEYGELKKREGVLEAEIRHHVSMLHTLKVEEPRLEEIKKHIPKFSGLNEFLREWMKANNLDPKKTKPTQLFDAASRQFPGITKASIGSSLQYLRRQK